MKWQWKYHKLGLTIAKCGNYCYISSAYYYVIFTYKTHYYLNITLSLRTSVITSIFLKLEVITEISLLRYCWYCSWSSQFMITVSWNIGTSAPFALLILGLNLNFQLSTETKQSNNLISFSISEKGRFKMYLLLDNCLWFVPELWKCA